MPRLPAPACVHIEEDTDIRGQSVGQERTHSLHTSWCSSCEGKGVANPESRRYRKRQFLVVEIVRGRNHEQIAQTIAGGAFKEK